MFKYRLMLNILYRSPNFPIAHHFLFSCSSPTEVLKLPTGGRYRPGLQTDIDRHWRMAGLDVGPFTAIVSKKALDNNNNKRIQYFLKFITE